MHALKLNALLAMAIEPARVQELASQINQQRGWPRPRVQKVRVAFPLTG